MARIVLMTTSTHPRSLRLAVIPGDGIGPEVVAEGLQVLRAAVGSEAVVETTEKHLWVKIQSH
jgi:3-isopropylmalate dehydrogenase